MMDHVSEVSRWLVGIKKLVQEVEKAPQHPTSPSVSCSYDTTADILQGLNLQTPSLSNGFPPKAETGIPALEYQHVVDPNMLQQVSDSFGGLDTIQAAPVTSYGADFCDPSTDQFTPRLSCSPPTFDPFAIEQCFNGHGELSLKFAHENHDSNGSEAKQSLDDHLDRPANGGSIPAETEDSGSAYHQEEMTLKSVSCGSPENPAEDNLSEQLLPPQGDFPGVLDEIDLSLEGTPLS